MDRPEVNDAIKEALDRLDEGCSLCSTFNFNKRIGIRAFYDNELTIYLASGVRPVPDDEQFSYCPKCGRKL